VSAEAIAEARAERNRFQNCKFQIANGKLISRKKGDRPIDLFKMIGRHGGKEPRFLPYGERSDMGGFPSRQRGLAVNQTAAMPSQVQILPHPSQSSSVVERSLGKGKVVGSIPTSGSCQRKNHN
jgi:hypothetical protein